MPKPAPEHDGNGKERNYTPDHSRDRKTPGIGSPKVAISRALGLVVKPEDRYICKSCSDRSDHENCDTLRQGRILTRMVTAGKQSPYRKNGKVCVCDCYGVKDPAEAKYDSRSKEVIDKGKYTVVKSRKGRYQW